MCMCNIILAPTLYSETRFEHEGKSFQLEGMDRQAILKTFQLN